MYYLNTKEPVEKFMNISDNPLYVDKSLLIDKLASSVNNGLGHDVCITRPRRFGKTINANMLAAYYCKNYDTKATFDKLKISQMTSYHKHINKYNVIYIDFSRMDDDCSSYNDYITPIKNGLKADLISQYHINIESYDRIFNCFNKTNDKFIFILDEWDFIFYKDFISEKDKEKYLDFLKDLVKDQNYVVLTYMTGILPIAKYTSGSSLNNFKEYNFLNDRKYSEFFGFTKDEILKLCQQYSYMKYEDLEYWYDGYYTKNNIKLFNPRSVYNAFDNEYCDNYWAETGPMNEIADCIKNNIDAVKKDIVQLVSGIPVKIKLEGYSATDKELKSRNNILSAMVIYGFLTYHDGCLYVPNHELMLKYEQVLAQKNMGGVHDIVERSERILEATLNKNEEILAQLIEESHDKEIDLFHYNDENSMACLLTLCYIKARDDYDIKREDKTGKGRCDMIFRPMSNEPAIIIELKVNDTPESAIDQIISKNYVQEVEKCDEIILVGISYNSDSTHPKYKKHQCKIVQYK
ncbi:MAG: ATP-binding protein [Erysipelotrichaceae bacterium]|nr:ATP-binding protein [Erysipelotrichaceae bacterium]